MLGHVGATYAPSVILALNGTLLLTLNALADMYSRKDGPWVDELLQAALNGPASQINNGAPEVQLAVRRFFADFRRQLDPQVTQH